MGEYKVLESFMKNTPTYAKYAHSGAPEEKNVLKGSPYFFYFFYFFFEQLNVLFEN